MFKTGDVWMCRDGSLVLIVEVTDGYILGRKNDFVYAFGENDAHRWEPDGTKSYYAQHRLSAWDMVKKLFPPPER